MAAGDDELESILRNFHLFSQGYKDALMEAQALRVNYTFESKKREALESHIADLMRDNERLRRLYTETLFKFTNQIKFHTESQSLKEELGNANSRLLSMEEVVNGFPSFQLIHKREIEQLKHGNEMNCNDLESKLKYLLSGLWHAYICERPIRENQAITLVVSESGYDICPLEIKPQDSLLRVLARRNILL